MEKKLETVDFQIAFGAVKHFGRNLYTTNPPAIAELIANTWDAYASKCDIITEKNNMIIIDNGIGMTDNEFKERYAKSGYEKDTDVRIPEDKVERPYMGQKGIGKFSAFSLSEEYTLFTKSVEDDDWKKITLNNSILNTKEATVPITIERIEDLSELKKEYQNIIFPEESGTIIVISDLRRKITKATHKALAQLLARRFSVTSLLTDSDFTLSINKETIDLLSHFYDEHIEFVYFFNIEKENITQRFSNVEEKNAIEMNKDYLTDNEVKGWIATVDKPAKLKAVDGTRISGVTIYINGKLADEDIFKNIRDDRIANSYIIGEIDANYLQNIEADPVLSSREGLNHEVAEVIELRKTLSSIRSSLIETWDEMRANRSITKQEYIANLIKGPVYSPYYDNLTEGSQIRFKRYAQKLFDKPSHISEEIVEIYMPVLFQLVNDETISSKSQEINEKNDDISAIFKILFESAEINSALRLQANIRNRLDIINELNELISSGEVEKVFEDHLAKNPWLIEPSWDAKDKRISTQNKYDFLDIDNNESRAYVDIIVDVSDDPLPIIVELKREKKTNYSSPSVNEIFNQITKYRSALKRHIERNKRGLSFKAKEIKAYFICGNDAKEKLSNDDLDVLDTNKIIIKTYSELLSTNKKIYIDGFEKESS